MNTSVTFKLKKPQGEPNLRQQREVLFYISGNKKVPLN